MHLQQIRFGDPGRYRSDRTAHILHEQKLPNSRVMYEYSGVELAAQVAVDRASILEHKDNKFSNLR